MSHGQTFMSTLTLTAANLISSLLATSLVDVYRTTESGSGECIRRDCHAVYEQGDVRIHYEEVGV
jgi:hypothetical protein